MPKINKHYSLTKIITTETMGRGVSALVKFRAGDTIEISPCLLIDQIDEIELQKTDLKLYVFDTHLKRDRPKLALALGCGSLFNHSKKPNTTYVYDEKSNCMIFSAISDIKIGEQLFINYGYDAALECKIQADRKTFARKQSETSNSKRD
jgi:SET domain-containing protein